MILRAALRLLAGCGFHGFSMKQLADEAGVAAGTLYLYFKDRDALIRQLHQEIIQTFAQHVLAGHDPDKPLQQQYRDLCQNVWLFCKTYPEMLLSKGQFDHLPPDVLRDHFLSAWQAFGPLRVLFDKCREQGMIKPLPDEILVTLGFETFINLARKYHLGLVSEQDMDVNEIIEATWHAIALDTRNRI
ncbi:TetR/AcrR family transcriptional regulator [Saccharophagus sp. K07]|uniref:TetR/AcrR family transcriptional regulator n=1 Tax=Saccharophagus sp. K07 TaxID=2283636 RepID=UPI001CA35521|nr:TetR/AcrR family transcriptional regulator [Saccharophagus sp. K07]